MMSESQILYAISEAFYKSITLEDIESEEGIIQLHELAGYIFAMCDVIGIEPMYLANKLDVSLRKALKRQCGGDASE